MTTSTPVQDVRPPPPAAVPPTALPSTDDDAAQIASYLQAHPEARDDVYALLQGNDPGMIFHVEAALATGAPALLAAGSVPTGSPTRVTGPERGGSARSDMQDQLNFEAQLNGGRYGADLNRAAAALPGDARLDDGSYRAAQNSREFLRSDLGNPLEIARYSGTRQQAVERVARFDRQIADKERDLQRWSAAAVVSGGKVGVREAAQAKAELEQLKFDRGEFINNVRLQSGRGENARMYQAVAEGVDPNRTPVIFVNGINTDVNRSRLQALELSAELNSPINHIVNVSSKDKLVRAGLGIGSGGALREGQNVEQFDQRVNQHLAGNRPAATATANAILDQLYDPTLRANGTPVKVIGYSQGASITAQALRDVDSYLTAQVNQGLMSQADKEKMLGRIEVLGIGPALAQRHLTQNYLSGGAIEQRGDLRLVDYRVIADRNDQISRLVGVGEAQPNTTEAFGAARRLAGNDFHAHLSYFRSYEAVDPGSIFNPEASRLLRSWFAGNESIQPLNWTNGR